MNASLLRRFLPARIAVAVFFGVLFLFPANAQVNTKVFQSGERLQYKVKWLFFRLGTIVVTTDQIPDHPNQFRVVLKLDSSPGLFFISLHNRYEGIVNTAPLRSEGLVAREEEGDDTLITVYAFHDSRHEVFMEQKFEKADTVLKSELRDSIDAFFDGPSLFFMARAMLHIDTTIIAPTMVQMDLFTTDITFSQHREAISIGALDDDVDTKELHGKANFEGSTFGGFSGEFTGWFSNDSAAVPIRAAMNITLGSVILELEQWSRGDWNPPLAREEQ